MGWARWAFNKAYSTCATVVGYVDYAVSPVKPLVKAIYNSSPIARFRHGVNKILHLPELLMHDGQTASLMRRSSLMMMQYLAFAWSIMTLEKMIRAATPDEIPYLESTLVWTLRLGFFVPRYLFRRLIDNLGITLSIPRAVNEDMNEMLTAEMSEYLAKRLWPGFKSRFFRHSDVGDTIDENEYFREFVIKLHGVFAEFFSQHKNNITEASFRTLIEPLRIVIYNTLRLSGTTVPIDIIHSLSHTFTTLAVSEFALCFSTEFIDAVTTVDDQLEEKLSRRVNYSKEENTPLLEKAENTRYKYQTELQQSLSKNYLHQASAKAYAEELVDIAVDLRAHVHPCLPIKYVRPCGCDFKKQIDAEISSPVYYLGNVLSFMLPDAAWYIGLLNDNGYNMFWYFVSGMRALNFGQSIYEYLTASEFQCTRHRYKKADKMHSLGLGVGYMAISEVIARAVSATTGVDNFLSRDAIENCVMQAITAAAIADRRPRVGMNDVGWDFFYVHKWLTSKTINGIKWLAFSEVDDAKGREKTIERMKVLISSPALHHAVILLLDENELIPKKENWQRAVSDIRESYQTFVGPYQAKKKEECIQQEKNEKKSNSSSLPQPAKLNQLKKAELPGLFCDENLIQYCSPVFAATADKHKHPNVVYDKWAPSVLFDDKIVEPSQKRPRRFKPFQMQSTVPPLIDAILQEMIQQVEEKSVINQNASIEKCKLENTAQKQVKELQETNDVMQVVCRYPAIQLILRTFRDEIDMALSAIKTGQSITKWIPESVISFPVPGTFAAFAHVALLLLKNDAFANAVQQFDVQMIMIRYLPKDLEARTEIVRHKMGDKPKESASKRVENKNGLPQYIMHEEKMKKRVDTVDIALLSEDAISKALNRKESELGQRVPIIIDQPAKEATVKKSIHKEKKPVEVTVVGKLKNSTEVKIQVIDGYADSLPAGRVMVLVPNASSKYDAPDTKLVREEPEEYEIVSDDIFDFMKNAKQTSGVREHGIFGRLARLSGIVKPESARLKKNTDKHKTVPMEMRTI